MRARTAKLHTKRGGAVRRRTCRVTHAPPPFDFFKFAKVFIIYLLFDTLRFLFDPLPPPLSKPKPEAANSLLCPAPDLTRAEGTGISRGEVRSGGKVRSRENIYTKSNFSSRPPPRWDGAFTHSAQFWVRVVTSYMAIHLYPPLECLRA